MFSEMKGTLFRNGCAGASKNRALSPNRVVEDRAHPRGR